jgi:hypothetical protein
MQKFQDAWNYPSQGLNTMLSAENMTPHDTATSGSGTSQTQTSSTPNWAALGMDLLNTGASLWKSDEKLKKDISSMGADPSTGVPIKSFRYKGQSPTAPKIVGPLAQDVEQAIPGSTVKVKGALTVPGPILKAATPSVSAKPSFVTKASKPVAMMGAKTMPRAGARGVSGALANTARRTSRAGLIGALG